MKPRPPDVKRIPRKGGRLTIAIGADYYGGIIVCADTKVVATDGATTADFKLAIGLGSQPKTVVIANAAEDGHAATMLAEEIILAIGNVNMEQEEEWQIKKVMTAWHNSYGAQQAPNLQFIVGTVSGNLDRILLCEPPATVLECHPVAIGRGARAVESFLHIPDGLVPHSASMRATLLRLAFLMYRAKKDEGSACGGDTHTAVIPKGGMFFLVPKEEMAAAEKLAAEIDELMVNTARMITTDLSAPGAASNSLETLSGQYRNLLKRWHNLDFTSIRRYELEREKTQKAPANTRA
jgi:hypothetical protein